MHIRLATIADAPYAAEVSFAAYWNNELYCWLYPQRDKYPSDLIESLRIRNKIGFLSPGVVSTVAVTDENDGLGDPGRIIGFAVWRRFGSDPEAQKWMHDRLDRYLLSWEKWYQDNFLDYATDWKRVAYFRSVISKVVFYKTLDDYWLLNSLAVHPQAQRRGIGSRLLEWGMQTAERESVPVVLESAPPARALYERAGLKVFEEIEVEGIEPGYAMLWEPDRIKGTWLTMDDKGNTVLRGQKLKAQEREEKM
ncbi:acyl-CoA N-acyltransferase [Pseudovirgaria hyperparasitica]|uniref:Acyl-CoA N-acyltransferase n=1 Tax=Pseudovirgaria hyperparasitica TaxID=470096 RepID=A0A6A6WAZ4_9PEZI|nr:acyl-CoA N-acyltransferase [Pseudovirgaria hyperparasitica]KAF2759349.1 acyl-CoA N-acyltransferase [Pseudovirgaria hyperparasitica]